VGDFAIFFINTILALGEANKVFGEVFRQIAIIGFDSLADSWGKLHLCRIGGGTSGILSS
jgi:hypothetical protein